MKPDFSQNLSQELYQDFSQPISEALSHWALQHLTVTKNAALGQEGLAWAQSTLNHFTNTQTAQHSGEPRFLMAQLNPQVGNLLGNAQQIAQSIQLAEALSLDFVAFPELSLMGYPVYDVITRFPNLVEHQCQWLLDLAKLTEKTKAFVGFVEPVSPFPIEDYTHLRFYNSVAILGNGTIEGVVRKNLLPTYSEFYDQRTFLAFDQVGVQGVSPFFQDQKHASPTVESPLITINGLRYGITICEDAWNDSGFFSNPHYKTDPYATLMDYRPDVMINLSASPSRSRKAAMKQALLSHLARRYQCPLVYVNQCGANDEISFDGASQVYSAQGELLVRGRSFGPDWCYVMSVSLPGLIHPVPDLGSINSPHLDSSQSDKSPLSEKIFNPDHTDDIGRTYESLLQGIRDYFGKTGFQKAVLGLSGGLDSSVCAVLLADALGPENVLGVTMPSGLTSLASKQDAERLISAVGIHTLNWPIEAVAKLIETELHQATTILDTTQPQWAQRAAQSFAHDNLQAMSRALFLRLLGNEYRGLPIATSDKSELYLGYATINGDMSGALAPLGDVPKTKVFALARWMNQNRPQKNAIPQAVLEKPPGAELAIDPHTGKALTAEEALMPYRFCDEMIWRIETLHQGMAEIMTAPFIYEAEERAAGRGVSPEQKAQWIQRFFQRMSAAVFKWWVLPPAIIVEGNGSITKTDYQHPITANRICWPGKTQAERDKALQPYKVFPHKMFPPMASPI